jgi:hypothetical protein
MAFLENSNDQQTNTSVQRTLTAWENRQVGIVEHLNDLIDNLENSLNRKAIELSRARHSASNIEQMLRIDRVVSKSGNFIYLTNTYYVKMRGAFLGISVYELNVTVRGQINMRTDTIQVTDDSRIIE